MNNEKCTKWLIEHGIKPTANRIVIARALASADRPMSMTELEESILTIDKSNIFRALTTFKEHHFVHVIEDGSDGVRYELCRSHSRQNDEDVHVHFFCECCHRFAPGLSDDNHQLHCQRAVSGVRQVNFRLVSW